MSQDEKTITKETRSIARQLARDLHPEEMDAIAGGMRGGSITCSCCRPDDCDA